MGLSGRLLFDGRVLCVLASIPLLARALCRAEEKERNAEAI
jgi:hypothetical protein